jgi:hypothetical protein
MTTDDESCIGEDGTNNYLDVYGDNGWELVTIRVLGGHRGAVWVFKREMEDMV